MMTEQDIEETAQILKIVLRCFYWANALVIFGLLFTFVMAKIANTTISHSAFTTIIILTSIHAVTIGLVHDRKKYTQGTRGGRVFHHVLTVIFLALNAVLFIIAAFWILKTFMAAIPAGIYMLNLFCLFNGGMLKENTSPTATQTSIKTELTALRAHPRDDIFKVGHEFFQRKNIPLIWFVTVNIVVCIYYLWLLIGTPKLIGEEGGIYAIFMFFLHVATVSQPFKITKNEQKLSRFSFVFDTGLAMVFLLGANGFFLLVTSGQLSSYLNGFFRPRKTDLEVIKYFFAAAVYLTNCLYCLYILKVKILAPPAERK